MDLGLDEATVLITGSSKGIGLGIAEAFLKEKATVILTGRNEQNLEAAKKDLSSRYPTDSIHIFHGNLFDEAELSKCAKDRKSVV